MGDGKPALDGRGLLRTFGSGETLTTAVQDVSLSLRRGEMALLMGPSGSGKSTLLAMLSGILIPTKGEVHCLDKSLWHMSEKELQVFRLANFGYIFQGYNLFPALTALQQLEIVLRWGEGVSAHVARDRSRAMLSQLGMSRKEKLRPAQLSGGEKQRVAIGRAMVKNPMFCFADEPTSALDWAHGEEVVELLRQAARERGTTVLVVAHDSRIIPYADRVLHMEDGCLVESEHAHDHQQQQLWSVP